MFPSFCDVHHNRERARKKKEEEEKRMEREREKVFCWSSYKMSYLYLHIESYDDSTIVSINFCS